ncbi:hypothetical protein IMSAGC014_00135 [Bacteroidaceae bacterium]|nr:hypothetical protein IMSAGC014_00135 [Bacteroidaceae bacterium]
MFLAHLVVARRAVLQVVTVAVLLEVVPFGRHLRRPERVVVFRVQVIVVVLRIYLLYVRQELPERFDVALFREHGQPHFTQRVERLKSRKHKSVVFEGVTYGVGHFMGQRAADGHVNHAQRLVNESLRLRFCQA